MKKVIAVFCFLTILTLDISAQNPFVLALYRVKSVSKANIDLSINRVGVSNMEKNTILWHSIYSNGELYLEAKSPGLPSGKYRFTTRPNDTIYLRVEAMGISYVSITKTTKEKMLIDLSKRDETFAQQKTEEKSGTPYSGGGNSSSNNPSSTFTKFGTGFLLSHEGYIITNFHVVDKAREITVKGINGNKLASYVADVVARDEANDLVILKLKDKIEIDSVPYTIQSEMSLLGEKIYVLGYPLKTTMGEDIKLVDGLISSKTGFESNVNSYQISAPVQPGNSGAPLFGDRGNLVGVVNAKHTGAENANYAIKARYIFMLAESVDGGVFINSKNRLLNKTFVEQVASIQKFVYIIEVK